MPHIFYTGCNTTIATVTLTYGGNSVALDIFQSSEGFQPIPSLEQAGYKVFGSVIPFKYQLDVLMTDAQRTALETVYNASQSAWAGNNDGSITVTETIRGTPSGKYLLDDLQIKNNSKDGVYRWQASFTLEKWVGTADTGIQSFVIGGNNYCRFSSLERPSITSVAAERGPAGAVFVQGISYSVPIIWNLGLVLTTTERNTLKATYDSSASTYGSGGDGKIAITDNIGGGTANVIMNNYQERVEKPGRWGVSFVLTQV